MSRAAAAALAGTQNVWRTVPADADAARMLAAQLALPLPVATVLCARGFTDEEAASRFLAPRLSDLADPFALPGMAEAVARIWQALDARERIVVFGDYDVDGVSSTALMARVLRALGGDVATFLPHRVEDGYGLSIDSLRKCIDQHQPRLVITVDCGTGSVEAVEAARANGVDVVVTDHHEASGGLAAACALVNPKLKEATRGLPLAGVGVVFKVCHALLKSGRDDNRSGLEGVDLKEELALVALGTVADVVPLVDENRALVRRGLAQMGERPSPGLAALKQVAKVEGEVSAYHVGFLLGPRLNAAGRLGTAERALELLTTEDPGRAQALAEQLDRANQERRAVEAAISEQALAQVEAAFDQDTSYGLVAAGMDWHPGVVGIVASRVSERFYRPSIVIGEGPEGRARGSCRSIRGFNLVEALAQCDDLLVRFGGHAMAAGVELEFDAVEAFRERFNSVAASVLAGSELLHPEQRIDAWLNLGMADECLVSAQDRLKPFGHGNPTPTWAARGVRVVGVPRVVGRGHLKLRLAEGAAEREAIGFNMAERALPDGPLDIVFQLKLDTFRGRNEPQLVLKDFRPAAPLEG